MAVDRIANPESVGKAKVIRRVLAAVSAWLLPPPMPAVAEQQPIAPPPLPRYLAEVIERLSPVLDHDGELAAVFRRRPDLRERFRVLVPKLTAAKFCQALGKRSMTHRQARIVSALLAAYAAPLSATVPEPSDVLNERSGNVPEHP
jgi:hypothetical protein